MPKLITVVERSFARDGNNGSYTDTETRVFEADTREALLQDVAEWRYSSDLWQARDTLKLTRSPNSFEFGPVYEIAGEVSLTEADLADTPAFSALQAALAAQIERDVAHKARLAAEQEARDRAHYAALQARFGAADGGAS